jgi:glycosyltransferase involved in cell wall biosynthesis
MVSPNKLKVLLNATTIIKGGGIQAVVSFILTLLDKRNENSIEWYLAVSEAVADQLEKLGAELQSERDVVFKSSPAKSRKERNRLLGYTISCNVDAVFTFFGPSYVKFPVTHICGVADGWTTHSDWEAYTRIRSPISRLEMLILCCYKGFWFRKADAWIVEQEAAKSGLVKRFRIAQDRVHIVPNNCGGHYQSYAGGALLMGERKRVLVFASFYPNKNIESVPYIAKVLVDSGHEDVEFILTIDSKESGFEQVLKSARALGVEDNINNIGPVDLVDGPALYKSCDILLMPSVLETFSAVYPEAMIMGVPIVTTDKTFARAICGTAAVYYESGRPEQAAAKILSLLEDSEAYTKLVEKGFVRQRNFPDASEKYELLCNIIKKYSK